MSSILPTNLSPTITHLLFFAGATAALAGCVPDSEAPASGSETRRQEVSSAPAQPSIPAQVIQERAHTPRPSRALQELIGSGRVHMQEEFGVPNFFWIARPAGDRIRSTRPDLPGGPSIESNRVLIERAAREQIEAHRDLYKLDEQVLSTLSLERIHDTGEGGVSASFMQRHAGHEVFGVRVTVIMTRALEPIAISGFASPVASSNSHAKDRFMRGEEESLAAALAALGEDVAPGEFGEMGAHAGYSRYQLSSPRGDLQMRSPARIKRVFFPRGNRLIAAHEVELDLRTDTGELGYQLVLSAHDGEVLASKSLIAHDAYTYKVWADADGMPYSNPFGAQLKPYTLGFFPMDYVAPTLVTVESRNMRGDAWLPPGATETVGNNVSAYADISGRDGFDGSDSYGESSGMGEFVWGYDFQQQPGSSDAQLQAPVVQLFYTINAMHDLFYEHGFDEEAGNAQEDNFGRGGFDGDSIFAESLDFSGVNNANMFTPSDGSSPRMQMYRFTYSSADRLTITAPAEIGGEFAVGLPGIPELFDIDGDLTLVDDGVAATSDACDPITDDLSDQIAFIDRGQCGFVDKILNAQSAGAIAVVIANNDTQRPDRVFDMGGITSDVDIPSVMVSYNVGQSIRQQLAVPARVSTRLRALPNQDASLDGDIVIHEWAHYLFGRLAGDGGSLQTGGMNEGNSDFVALMIAAREDDVMIAGNDQFQGAYPMGQYAGHRYNTGTRRVAYSTDMSIDPLTFRHISDRAALPPSIADGSANSQVHNTGEVWATAMWECHVALLNEHGWADGRARMFGYLVAGLKGFPRDATFIEARDSILAAMRATDEDDFRTCFFTFAKRGMGVGAKAPGRYASGNVGVLESFEIGGSLELSYLELKERESCDNDGYLDVGERAEISVEVANEGADALSGVVVRLEVYSNGNENIPRRGVSYPEGNEEILPDLQPFGLARVTIPITLDEALGSDLLSYRVIAEHPDAVAPATLGDGVLVNTDVELASSRRDDVQFGEGDWITDRDATLQASGNWDIESSGNNSYWHAPEVAYKTDLWLITPKLNISSTQDFVFSFDHRHDFELGQYAWDGAVIEITTDDGNTWTDIGDFDGAQPRYSGVIANAATLFGNDPAENNPLSDRPAYAGANPSFPEFDTVIVRFGRQLAGKTARLRFRMGTDQGTSGDGWDIDNITFEGIDNTPFPALVDEESLCGAGPKPEAKAGPDQVVTEGATVTLDSAATINPAGGELSYEWVRLSGPMVTFEDAAASKTTFVAPRVEESTEVSIQLTVSDGEQESFDELVITVNPVNDPPIAVIEVVGEVAAGETITLDGSSSSDEDGDTLSFAWAQTAGPGVALQDATSPTPSFVAPALEEGATLSFQLIVSDGKSISAAATVEIDVPASTEAPDEMKPDEDPGDKSKGGEEEGRCASAPPASGAPAAPGALLALLVGAIAARRRRRRVILSR